MKITVTPAMSPYQIPQNISRVAAENGLYIDADTTTGAIEILFPEVSDGIYPIIVSDTAGNSATNNITCTANGAEEIEGEASYTIDQNGGVIKFGRTSETWNAEETGSVAIAAAVQKEIQAGTTRYRGRIDQDAAAAPTVTDFENNTSFTFTPNRTGDGEYYLESDTPLDVNRCQFIVNTTDFQFVLVPSYVDSLGFARINLRKYMLDGSPAADGLVDVDFVLYISPTV